MCTVVYVSILGYEWVALSGVQWVDVTVCVVEGAVPQVLGQLEGHLPLCQRHFLSMPYVHLTTKVKHQNLHRNTDRGNFLFIQPTVSFFLLPLGGAKVQDLEILHIVALNSE